MTRPILADLVDLWDRLRGRPPRPRGFPPNRWTRAEVERRIAHEPVEWAYVFDRSGRQVFRARGGEGFVAIALESLRLRNAVLVHNHPDHLEYPPQDPRYEGGSFSDQDVDLAIAYNLGELVAITSGWRYVMMRPAAGWAVDAESAVAFYTEQLIMVRNEVDETAWENSLARAAAEGRVKDEIMQRTADWAGFVYRREALEP